MKPEIEDKVILFGGLAIIGGGLYLASKEVKPPPPPPDRMPEVRNLVCKYDNNPVGTTNIVKRVGDLTTGTLQFEYKGGPCDTYGAVAIQHSRWGHESGYAILRLATGFFRLPVVPDWTQYSASLDNLPFPSSESGSYNCQKFLGWMPPGSEALKIILSDWDDMVFLVRGYEIEFRGGEDLICNYNGFPEGTTGIRVRPGDNIWGRLFFWHKGKGITAWFGFGLAPQYCLLPYGPCIDVPGKHNDPLPNAWFREPAAIPQDDDWTYYYIDIPPMPCPPIPAGTYDCKLSIADTDFVRTYAEGWDDDVFIIW